jgi:hypothetical protein
LDRLARSPLSVACLAWIAILTWPPVAYPQFAHELPESAADSVAVRRHAERAQRDFEDQRRALLPPGRENVGGPCDERIGRFCYWYSPYSDPPPEPAATATARIRLLAELADAGRRLPGDEWVAGQRVRYLAEQGWGDSAVAVARACAADRWWCEALEGFARHAAGQFEAADSAFTRALARMPPEQRCRWIDLGAVVGRDARGYRSLGCEERAAANAWIWWLARPLLSRSGNDLRTEHFSRQVMVRMLEHSAWAHDRTPWDWDAAELVIRYGWSSAWSRPGPDPWSLRVPPVVGQDRTPSYWFFTDPVRWETAPDALAGIRWHLTRSLPPARYGPRYAARFGSIEHLQLARFRRPSGILSVAVFSLAGDTVLGGRVPTVALAAGRDPATALAVGDGVDAAVGTVAVESPWPPRILSLEAQAPEAAGVARSRVIVPGDSTPGPVGMSDLLLFRADPNRELPDSLDLVLARALATASLPRGAQVGLFWEVYGFPDSAGPEVEVRVVPLASGGRAVSPLGRAGCVPAARARMALRWSGGGKPALPGRSVLLDLARLKPGRYAIEVWTEASPGDSACATREVEIR